MLSGENGILKQAVKAKEETEKKSIQENIQLAVLSAMSNTNHELTLDSLATEVQSQLGSDVLIEQDGIGGYVVGKNKDTNGHLTDVYGVVDKEGKVGDGKWHFVKLTDAEGAENANKDVKISDGLTSLIVGNKIDYDANKDENGNPVNKIYTSKSEDNGNGRNYTYKTEKYDSKEKGWGILGAENGKVLIAPMYSIMGKWTETTVEKPEDDIIASGEYNSDLYLKGQKGYENGISELNKISEIYGYGKGAESARSITVEDINKITGYDPNYEGQNVNKIKKEELKLKRYAEDTKNEYGSQVKYYWERKWKSNIQRK